MRWAYAATDVDIVGAVPLAYAGQASPSEMRRDQGSRPTPDNFDQYHFAFKG